MNQLGSNTSRAEREQTLGRNVARLLRGAWTDKVQSPKSNVQRPRSNVQRHVAVDRHWTLDVGLSTALTEPELNEITPLLCRSGAGALAWCNLRDTPLADTAAGRELHEVYRRFRLSALLHEREIVQVISLLRAAGIEPVLVKGWAIARRYPDRALRPYGDIDLCVAPAQFAQAQAILAGFADINGPFVDLHSGFANIGIGKRLTISILRDWLSSRSSRVGDTSLECGDLSPLSSVATRRDHRLNQAAERLGRQAAQDQSGDRSPHSKNSDWDELYARSQIVMLDDGAKSKVQSPKSKVQSGFPVRILSDEDHLRLLCVHLLRSGARRPAWLCDVAVIVEQVSSFEFRVSSSNPTNQPGTRNSKLETSFNWSTCLGRNPVHAAWVGVAVMLAHELLGVDISQTPFAGQQLPRWLAPAVLKQWAVGSGQWAEAVQRPKSKVQMRSPTSRVQRPKSGHWTLDLGPWTSLYRRWDNPIRATAAVGGRFDERSRLGYRVLELLARTPEVPDHLRRLWQQLRSRQKAESSRQNTEIRSESLCAY